ncbi:MAG TPA: hypothetical protein VG146_06735, partial [Verrucomicrobiae bacterium]|nr:hypothetical protein [Verrucomicrobiae bacterium]
TLLGHGKARADTLPKHGIATTKSIHKARNAIDLIGICPSALYAFCMLSEHHFGKVGKSQETHRSEQPQGD